jgi:hypothetical protein
MKIQVTGKTLQLPTMCACCAEAADSKYEVVDVRNVVGNKAIVSKWQIPYCTQCKAHVEQVKMGWQIILLCIVTLGLFYISYLSFWRPWNKKRVKAKMCKPSCGSVDGVEFSTDGVTNTFDFPSEVFAKKFAQMNGVK